MRNAFALFLTQGKVSCRHLAGFPSNKFFRFAGAGLLYKGAGSLRPKM
jgi:hypothetical protein